MATANSTNHMMIQVAQRLHMQPALLWDGAGADQDLAQFAQVVTEEDRAEQEQLYSEWKMSAALAYGQGPSVTEKPYAFSNGIAIIPIHGMLINRFGSSWSFVTGYNFIQRMALLADADPDVELIVFDCNSGGGEVAGCPETGAILAGLEKPTLAMVDSRCYSACYWLASQADKIAVISSGGVGSVGAITMHVSMEGFLKSMGIEVTIIAAGEHKADGNQFERLPDSVKDSVKDRLETIRKDFAGNVATGRGMSVEAVLATEANCYSAAEALSLGFIDSIATPSDAIIEMLSGLSEDDENQTEDEDMKDDATKPAPTAATPVVVDASAERQNERNRVKIISTHANAAAQKDLAEYLAYETDMPAEQATSILDKVVAAPAAATPAATLPEGDADAKRFDDAMNASKNPDLKPDADNGGKKNPVDSILALVPDMVDGK